MAVMAGSWIARRISIKHGQFPSGFLPAAILSDFLPLLAFQ